MAFDDLCTADDVISEGNISEDVDLDDQIDYRIPKSTIEVYSDAELGEEPTDETELYYAQMACIYNVLDWLEQKSLIESLSDNIKSIKDSQTTITYADTSSGDEPDTYESKYKQYIQKLKPVEHLGARARRHHW